MKKIHTRSLLSISSLCLFTTACSGTKIIGEDPSGAGGLGGAGGAGGTGQVDPPQAGASGAAGSSGGSTNAGNAGQSPGGGTSGGGAGQAGAGQAGAGPVGPMDDTPPEFLGINEITSDSHQVTLAWAPATDDITPSSEIVYLIYVSTEPNAVDSGSRIVTSQAGATSVTVANLNSNTTYYFVVRAMDAAQNQSGNDHEVSGETLVSFADDVQPIFTTSCAKSNCHGNGGVIQKGLDLSAGDAYDNTVNVPTRGDTSVSPYWSCMHINRVQPGNPDQSFLWHKITHTDALSGSTGNCTDPTTTYDLGEAEPRDLCNSAPGCPALPQTTLDTVTLWIQQGALNN